MEENHKTDLWKKWKYRLCHKKKRVLSNDCSAKTKKLGLKPKTAFSAGYSPLFYSYRVKYNGSFATFFLSFREMLSSMLMFLSSMFSHVFFALIETKLNMFLLQVFSSRVFNFYTILKGPIAKYLVSENKINISKLNFKFIIDV